VKLCSFRTNSFTPKIFSVYAPDIVGDDMANDCEDLGWLQGFSWRNGNVDFYTIYDIGMDVEVFLNETVQLPKDTARAIQVPFTVGPQGVGFYVPPLLIDVLGVVPKEDRGRVSSYLPMPVGEYALIFAHGFMPNWNEDGYFGEDDNDTTCMWGQFWFNQQANAEPKILVDGSPNPHLTLKPTYPLRMDAEPLC
jgi:hypothetical protein